LHDSHPVHHLRAGLAVGMDRDHRHLHADLPAAVEDVQHRSIVLRAVGRAQYSDLVPIAAGRDGAVLSQGRGTGLGQHQRHFPRRDAVHDHRHRLDDHALYLPANRPVAAESGLPLTHWRSPRRTKMVNLAIGIVILAVTAVVFWYCLPRGGRLHRFVDTELEPYGGGAFCSAVALSLTMILSGIINMPGGHYELAGEYVLD